MSHPYLNFSLSENYDGYAVGTSTNQVPGNGLNNKNIEIIQIPRFFNKLPVTEIGIYAFQDTKITSFFSPKTIKCINIAAFYNCRSLSEVRFEVNSQLEKIGYDACGGTSVTNFDIPKNVKIIDYNSECYFFNIVRTLKCCSYSGTTDFSNYIIFYNSPTIRVSQNYPTNVFGQESVTHKDGSTCGVSNKPFYGEVEKTFNIRRERFSRVIFFLVLILVS